MGLVVNLVLGTAAFGAYAGHPPMSEHTARQLIDVAVDAGIRYFDTAQTYGEAERWLGASLRYRPQCMIATKIATDCDVSVALDQSRLRQRRRVLDVVQIHNATASTLRGGPLLHALLHARERGDVKKIGASVYDVDAAFAAVESGLDVVQVPYNLIDQRMGQVFAVAKHFGVTVWARSPWLRGALAFAGNVPIPAFLAAEKAGRRLLVHGQALSGVALRFALDGPSAVIVGPRTLGELDDAVDAAKLGRLPFWQRWLAPLCESHDVAVYDPRCWRPLGKITEPDPAT